MRVRPLLTRTVLATVAMFGLLGQTPTFAATSPSSVTVSACDLSSPSATESRSRATWTSATDTLVATNDCSGALWGRCRRESLGGDGEFSSHASAAP